VKGAHLARQWVDRFMALASVRRGLRAGSSGRDEMVLVMVLAQSKSGIGVLQNNSTFLDSELLD
jgi:hypothetical protein